MPELREFYASARERPPQRPVAARDRQVKIEGEREVRCIVGAQSVTKGELSKLRYVGLDRVHDGVKPVQYASRRSRAFWRQDGAPLKRYKNI